MQLAHTERENLKTHQLQSVSLRPISSSKKRKKKGKGHRVSFSSPEQAPSNSKVEYSQVCYYFMKHKICPNTYVYIHIDSFSILSWGLRDSPKQKEHPQE